MKKQLINELKNVAVALTAVFATLGTIYILIWW